MKTLIKKMNRRHFDVSDGEIVVYKDPLIGRLESRDKRLLVKLNWEAYQLELWVDGRPVSVFDLAAGVAKASQDGHDRPLVAATVVLEKLRIVCEGVALAPPRL